MSSTLLMLAISLERMLGSLIFASFVRYCDGVNFHSRSSVVLTILLFSVTAALSQEKPADFDWQKAKGTIVSHVPCLDDPQESYALYLPPQYSPDRPWPVIYAFDPDGDGEIPVKAYEAAAEKYGFIVVGSNNSKNGSEPIQIPAAKAMWLDTHRRFPIDKKRVYTTGFSGGARVATMFALYCSTCNMVGVMAYGSGYPLMDTKIPYYNDHFAYFAGIGETDFNYPEIMTLRRTKDEQGTAFKVQIYPGGHQWATPAVAQEAVEWMNLKAMQSSQLTVDRTFVQSIFEQTEAEEAQAEKKDDTPREYYALRSLVKDFNGLEDVTKFQEELASLRSSAAWAEANRQEQREIALQASLAATVTVEISEMSVADPTGEPGLDREIVFEMKSQRSQGQSNGKDHLVHARAYAQLFMEAMQGGEQEFDQGNYAKAVSFFELVAEAAPDRPGVLVSLAEAKLRLGDRRGALKALQQAVQHGLKDRAALTGDLDLKSLASDPAFQRIVQGME